MDFIFFQNCISPHQIPYIRECAKDNRVEKIFLIVPRTNYQQRTDMGWDSSKLLTSTTITCKVMPSDEYIANLLKTNEESYCFFSGIRADADVFRWFKLSLTYNVKRYIITEPPFTYKKPLWMHYLRFYLQDYKYVKYINGIFGFGQAAVNYYKSISDKWKVFPFQYVTEYTKRLSDSIPIGAPIRLLFVGSLTPRKNVKVVLEALENLADIRFTIVGDGEERNMLKKIAQEKNLSVTFEGKKQMKDIPNIMEQHDILILPSLHDGWGAVVNEAMTLGLYVIVSNKCGAKALIKDETLGVVFKNNDAEDLHKILFRCIDNKESIRNEMKLRLECSKMIQGHYAAQYFINCLEKQ